MAHPFYRWLLARSKTFADQSEPGMRGQDSRKRKLKSTACFIVAGQRLYLGVFVFNGKGLVR